MLVTTRSPDALSISCLSVRPMFCVCYHKEVDSRQLQSHALQRIEVYMCRWLAYLGSAIPLEDVLVKPNHSLIDQSLRARQLFLPNSRSEEHTSELQSRFDLVCRLLL